MKKLLLFFLCLYLIVPSVNASTSSAYEYVLMDMNSKRVLASKNMNSPRLIASISKIMTCIVAIENKNINDIVKVTDIINESYGSGIYIEIDEEITLRDLLYGLMLRSGNDAALMIAEYVGESVPKFVEMMNNKAKDLGMTNTIFKNPSGLDNNDTGNYSTAYDMALLTSYAMENKEYRNIVKTKKHTVKTNKKTYIWKNKNKLLNEEYITGGKTGYTEKAKRTLVSTASSDNMNLVVVTIKDSDDWNTHKDLYQYAFNNYNNYKILKKGNIKIIGDTYYNGTFYIKNDIDILLKKEELGNLISKIELEKKEKYQNKDKVGEYKVYFNEKLMHKEPIYIKNIKKNKGKIFKYKNGDLQ